MLRVKESVPFDVLKNYNFFLSDHCGNDNIWVFKDIDGKRRLLVFEYCRTLAIVGFGPWDLSDRKLDVIYDLITDGVVEKVDNDDEPDWDEESEAEFNKYLNGGK